MNFILIVFVCLSWHLNFFSKNLQFYKLSYPQYYHTYVTVKSEALLENVSTSFFNYILFFMNNILCLKITTKIFSFEIFPMNVPYFIWNMLYKTFIFVRKWLHFLFQLCDNICMPIIVSEIFPRNLQFYNLSHVILNFIIHTSDENLQFYQKICLVNFSNVF